MKRLRLKKKFKLPFRIILILVLINLIMHMPKPIFNNNDLLKYLISNSNHYLIKQDYKKEIMILTKYITALDINNPVLILSKSTGYNLDIEKKEELKEEKPIPVINENVKKVYIYNTHQEEQYSDLKTVKDMSYILKNYLNDLNVDVIVEEGNISEFLRINNWNYDYSYLASKYFIEENINKNDYDLIIDLHRDALPYNSSVTTIDGKTYAKILFVVGKENPNYEKNLELMTKLNNKIIEKYPSLSRGIILKEGAYVNGIYNQDINEKIILLEVGGNENSSEEASNTLKLIADIIKEVI